MKKILSLLLAAVLVFGLAACGGSPKAEAKPDETVKAFCEALKSFDIEAMAACFEGENAEQIAELTSITGDELDEVILDYLKDCASYIEYTIGNTLASDSDHNKVITEFNYKDCSAVMDECVGNFFMKALEAAFSGNYTDEQLETLTYDLYSESFSAAKADVQPAEGYARIEFNCIKTEDGWKIADVPEKLRDVITANMYDVLHDGEEGDLPEEDDFAEEQGEDAEDPFGGEDEWEGYAPDFSDYVMANVAIGNSATVNEVDIRVLSCEETDHVDGLGTAESGYKYVLFNVGLENKTADDQLFISEGCFDSQGNYYLDYYDFETDLNLVGSVFIEPGQYVEGTIIYKLPEEAEGYYIIAANYLEGSGARFYGEY